MEPAIHRMPIIFLVNKHDQEHCVSIGYITDYFEISENNEHEIKILHISALTQ